MSRNHRYKPSGEDSRFFIIRENLQMLASKKIYEADFCRSINDHTDELFAYLVCAIHTVDDDPATIHEFVNMLGIECFKRLVSRYELRQRLRDIISTFHQELASIADQPINDEAILFKRDVLSSPLDIDNIYHQTIRIQNKIGKSEQPMVYLK